ncbi:MAG: MBL fold metallo-hydrolase, partial [Bacteroidota bacterium]
MQIHTLDLKFHVDEAIAAFVLESTDGPILIETGPHSTWDTLVTGLDGMGYKPSDFRHVLLSHIHFDHAGAAWAMARAGATVYVHPRGHKHLLDPSRLYGSAKRIYGDMMEQLWGEMHPIPEGQLIAVEDDTVLELGEHKIKALHTPGHASHHIAWAVEDVIFTGDVGGVKIGGGPVVAPCPPPDIDLEAWYVSINRLRAESPNRLFLTHFGMVEEVEPHLQALEKVLESWGRWMKPHFDAQRSVPEITPEFQAFVKAELEVAGLDKAG